MGTQYVESQYLESLTCPSCGVLFAMPSHWVKSFRDSKRGFFCPAGHEQWFSKTTSEKLKEELARKEEMLAAANARTARIEAEKHQAERAHHKMRARVMNGVCPCCNRSFGNLREHMKTQHPDFAETKTLAMLRESFGMTQGQVAKEAGVVPMHVSLYERGKPVTGRAKEALDRWVTNSSGGKLPA